MTFEMTLYHLTQSRQPLRGRPQEFLQRGKVYLLSLLFIPLFFSPPFSSHPSIPSPYSLPPSPLCPALSIMRPSFSAAKRPP